MPVGKKKHRMIQPMKLSKAVAYSGKFTAIFIKAGEVALHTELFIVTAVDSSTKEAVCPT